MLFGRADGADPGRPTVALPGVLDTVEAMIDDELGGTIAERGPAYLGKLRDALDSPVGRVLVASWRTYEEFLAFTADGDKPASSGEVDLIEHEVEAYWEIVPRLEGESLGGTRLLVTLTLGIESGTVSVRNGRIVGLAAGAVTYEGTVALRGVPGVVAEVGPGVIEPDGARLDFGEGWPIRPDPFRG